MHSTSNHTFILNDGYNLFHRQARTVNPKLGVDSMIGMSFHMLFHSMKKEFINFNGSHCVFFTEGRSWRKDVYPAYKANRSAIFAKQTPEEQENFKILSEAFNDFVKYLLEKTNVSVIRNPNAEADDMIYTWILQHPNDRHVLISSDSDFFQLLKFPNVVIYDPVKDITISRDGITDDRGNRLSFTISSNARIKIGKPDSTFSPPADWYEYALFLKCIRGDGTDNIFSAYPGVREKGTKNSIGIVEAYNDRVSKGYSWNNFMLQKWVDYDGVERQVRNEYEINRNLIDLSCMPDNVAEACKSLIAEQARREVIPAINIGTGFLKFCGLWDLKKIGQSPDVFMNMLKSKYPY